MPSPLANSSHHSTPLSPYTLATDRYKTNVNRTKTRKWVEAKKVDYGGDDWGADDDFEEDDAGDGESGAADRYQAQAPPQPQPHALRPGRLTAGLRAVGEGSSPSTPRSGSAGSARSMRPSERIAMERQASGGQQRSVTGPPALHIHTGVQPQRPVQSAEPPSSSQLSAQPQFPPRKSSMTNQDRPDLTIDPTTRAPRAGSRSESPAGPPETAVRSPLSSAQPKVIRPSEIYRRMEAEKERGRRSSDAANRPSLESSGSRNASGADLDGSNEGESRSSPRPSGDGSRALQPLATVDERKSEYGFDGLMVNPSAPATSEPSKSGDLMAETSRDVETKRNPEPSLSSLPTLQHPPSSDAPEVGRRFSTSPKLPDLTRMSGFGSDFFGGGGFMSESPKQPEAPAEVTPKPVLNAASADAERTSEQAGPAIEQKNIAPAHDDIPARYSSEQIPEPSQPRPFRPAIPGGWVSETASTPGEMATPGTEQARYGLGIAARGIPSVSGHSEDASLKPAPLRTPTPRDRSPKKLDDDSRSSNSAQPSPVPRPLRTTASALSKESSGSKLDEAHASDTSAEGEAEEATPVAPAPLQPAKGSQPDLSPEELRRPITRVDTSTTENPSPLKESDYLRDEIMRSLSPVRKSSAHLDTLPDEGVARESAYLSDVYGDYWQDDEATAGKREETGADAPKPLSAVNENYDSASATPTPPAPNWTTEGTSPSPSTNRYFVPASEPEVVESSTERKRFSWEAAAEKSEPAAPSPNKHPLPAIPKDEDSVPSTAPELASPVDSGRLSPLLTLPVLNFGRDDVAAVPREESAARVVSSSSTFPPGQDKTTMDLPSPASPSGGHEGPSPAAADRRSMFFMPSDEKVLATQSPTSPGSPEATHAVPDSPHSAAAGTPTDIPLPRSPSPTGEKPSSAHSPQVMNLKQIMALPTSPERVYKMLEVRAEFAATPSGLEEWLTEAAAQAEHANAGPAFKYPPAGDDLPLFSGHQNQKYTSRRRSLIGGISGLGIGTSSGGGGGDGGGDGGAGGGAGLGRQHSSVGNGGSVRIAGAASAQLGNLMHGQAGVKGKELLQSAGKMGKGLLSKGKSKLRERAESKKG